MPDRAARGVSWRCRSELDPRLTELATAGMMQAEEIAESDWIKRRRRRRIFRVRAGSSAVVKGNHLTRWSHRVLWHRRYAAREARNLDLGAERGLPVPALLATGRRRLGLHVDWVAIMIEDLAPRVTLEAALRAAADDPARQSALLDRAGRLLEALHGAAVLHADPSGQSFLVGSDEADDRICDFQYASARRQTTSDHLAFQTAYLADTLAPFVPPGLLEPWTRELLGRVAGHSDADAASRLRRWRGRRLSRRERLRL